MVFVLSFSFGAEGEGVAELDEDLPVEALAAQLLAKIKAESPESVWEHVTRLVRLGKEHGGKVTRKLEAELKSDDEKLRLAAARALCQLNSVEEAAPVLHALLLEGKNPDVRRMAANSVGLSALLYDDEATPKVLSQALKKETDPATRLSLARTLWRVGNNAEGKQELVRQMRSAPEKAVRDEAALVLAEIGFLLSRNEWGNMPEEDMLKEIYTRVVNLSLEPTPQGERAFNLYRTLEDHASRSSDPKLRRGELLVREILNYIQKAYPDQDKAGLEKLFEGASKGLVDGLDAFSQYLDEEEVQATQEMLRQDYGGIGAYVGIRDRSFSVISPIYNSPADRAGLKSLDTILEVDGEKTDDLMQKGGMSRIIAKLKGKAGTPVRVKFFRRGFIKPLEVTIVRDTIKVDSVLHTMLPGSIGYIRLTRFGERSSEEMAQALEDLIRDKKARGLIFDLRDNPGGLLRAGVEIADKFLSGTKLIVYSEGLKEFSPRKDFHASGGDADEAFPMVALVNSGSASASEIVAGALQDHKRAVLVGEKTYGKGSVQQIIPLRATHQQTQLRLTVAKYFLPSGRCIHEKGIEPDVKAEHPETDDWTLKQIFDLRQKHTIDDYVRSRWDAHKAAFLKLALDDGGNLEAYPDFNALYQGLAANRIEKDAVRAEVRRVARRMAQDEQKQEYACDLFADFVLQRGVFELLSRVGLDPATIAQYKDYPERFQKKAPADLGQGAMLPEDTKPAP